MKENLQQCTFPLENFLFRHFAIVLTFLFSSSSSSSMQKFFFGFAHKCVRRKLFSINDSKRMAVKKKSIPIKKKIQARKFILFFSFVRSIFWDESKHFQIPRHDLLKLLMIGTKGPQLLLTVCLCAP